MSKMVRLAVLAALLLSIATAGLVSAQAEVAGVNAAVTYTSGFQVQNLEATDASVQLEFYRQDGTLAVTPAPTYTIPANGSKTFFPINDLTQSFNGSLVILADKEVRAVNNLLGSGPGSYFAATNGFQSGSTTVSLPLIMCNNSGFNTFFNVQNAGDADANITITYVPGSNGTAGVSETATIPKGAAKTFDQTEGSATKNCAQLKDASPGKFIGSATITSNQPVVAAVMQLNTVNFQVLMAYGGFTGGSPTVALPLVMANNSNYYTGIQVQNAGTQATNVTITYSANTAGAKTPAAEVFNLAPGASKTIIQSGTPAQSGSAVNDWTTLGRYIGGAIITNSAGQPLVAIANQVRPSPALGAAYEGFNPVSATTKISAALIMSNNGTYYTGLQVQNVTGGNVQVTVHYSPNTVGTFAPVDETFTLAAGASKTIIQNGTAPGNGSSQNWTQKYVGSATITGTGNIVAIVNQVSNSVAGDQFASSDAFNY